MTLDEAWTISRAVGLAMMIVGGAWSLVELGNAAARRRVMRRVRR